MKKRKLENTALKIEMLKQGKTQGDAAQALGISRNLLNAKINGRAAFTVDQVKKLGEFLNLSDAETIRIFLA